MKYFVSNGKSSLKNKETAQKAVSQSLCFNLCEFFLFYESIRLCCLRLRFCVLFYSFPQLPNRFFLYPGFDFFLSFLHKSQSELDQEYPLIFLVWSTISIIIRFNDFTILANLYRFTETPTIFLSHQWLVHRLMNIT